MILKIKNSVKFFLSLLRLIHFRLFKQSLIKKAEIIFFFPFYHTGGAERVHVNIVKALSSKRCCVIFTQGSATTNFLSDFKANSHVIELNSILNKKIPSITEKLQSYIVNSINNNNIVKCVFGCNTNYFYKILPQLASHKKKIDLIHALAEDDDRKPLLANSAKLINKRVVINKKAKQDLVSAYKKYNVSKKYINSIKIISNGVKVLNNEYDVEKKKLDHLKIGYVGRWSAEKRPELFLNLSSILKKKYINAEFVMAGTGMRGNLDEINRAGVIFLGEITNENELVALYKSLNIIIICSEYEGFPMVLMESMQYGVIPVCTNVGGINEHITHNYNGLLINETTKEDVLNSFVFHIKQLVDNERNLREISKNASRYAISHFSEEQFYKEYFELLS